jgi:formate hydrogenlyase transcriptional activator
MDALCRYPWPGNIRELQNVIERAVILSRGPALVVPLVEMERHTAPEPPREDTPLRSTKRRPVRSILADVDRDQIIRALKETDGRVGGPDGAASRLGLKRTTLITRMKKLGIDPDAVSVPDKATPDRSDTSDTSDAMARIS